MAAGQRVLVIANRTADSPDLIEALRRRLGERGQDLPAPGPRGPAWPFLGH